MAQRVHEKNLASHHPTPGNALVNGGSACFETELKMHVWAAMRKIKSRFHSGSAGRKLYLLYHRV